VPRPGCEIVGGEIGRKDGPLEGLGKATLFSKLKVWAKGGGEKRAVV